jgi:hypothetical protein
MSKQLFAFRLAKPIEAPTDTGVGAVYDPNTQAAVWYGGSTPLAVYCTRRCWCCIGCALGCNAYGSYCTRWNYNSWCCYYRCDS